jgi:tetratricopeptide (TPR) repeat protein
MARFFRKVTGNTCNQEECTLQGQSAEPGQTRCEECCRPLFELTVSHRTRQGLAALVAVLALAGTGYGAFTFAKNRPQQVRQQAPPRPAAVTPSRPRTEPQRQVAAKVREIYRNGEAGAAQKEDLAKLVAGDPGLTQAYAELERSRLPQIIEACRRGRTGQRPVSQKLFEHARTDFLIATEEDPENANAWAALGGADMLTHRETEARQAYEHALAVDPDSWIAHYNFGFYFARKGETEPALQHLDRAVSLLNRAAGVDRAAVVDDLRKNPVLDLLRRDPRFERLLC